MTYHMAALTLCVFTAGISACADRATAPDADGGAARSPARAETFAVTSAGAEQAWGTSAFIGDGSEYRECLGEVVHIHNEMPIRWHRVIAPSGNVMFSDPFIPNAGTGQTEGLTSGRIWTLDRVVSPEVINTNAGVEQHFVAVLYWARPTGPNFTMENTYRFVQNANGDVTMNSFEARCVLQGRTPNV
ncbi:MAG: hypothetical protein ACJ79K_13400 [Gemmatimonadaceae bacterium]